jgi:c-di-GMP-binding flagellar brake protein YcgR
MPAPKRQVAASQIDRRRRRHTRYRADFRVAVSYLENQYQTIDGHCRDLSEAGIGILLATEMNSGQVVGLTFSLPGSIEPWEVRAVVRYRRGYQYGFEFLSLTSAQQETLKTYLGSLPQLAPSP